MRVASLGAIVLLLSAGCARGAQTTPAEPLEITLQRTGCFGTCPDYTVTVNGDGTVVYTGRYFVKTPGQHTWTIEPAAARALAREMEAAGFFELRDEYTSPMTDNPTTFTTLRIGSRTKKVKDYVTGPPKLKDIEARIDEVSGVLKYVAPDRKLVQAIDDGDANGVRSLLAGGASTPRARVASAARARSRRSPSMRRRRARGRRSRARCWRPCPIACGSPPSRRRAACTRPGSSTSTGRWSSSGRMSGAITPWTR